MKCFVMKTVQYDDEAQKYNCRQVFNRFKHEVESKNDYTHPKDVEFSFGGFIKKRHQNLRTIFQYRNLKVDGQDVRCYVALKVYPRGNQEYELFYTKKTPEDTRGRLVGTKNARWEDYENQIAELLKIPDTAVEFPPLTSDENNYIQRTGGLTHEIFDTKIIESKYWVETVRNKCFKDFYKLGEALIKMFEDATLEDRYGLLEGSYGEKGMKFLCGRPPEEKGDSWYLLQIGTQEQLDELRNELKLSDDTSAETYDQFCCRAYPYSMMEKDLDFWMDMETDEHSNFILSGEELKIVSSELKFPLFLTGRAGSGKSTMLQYLFAEYFLRYLEYDGINPPVYLSYSSNLIDNARKLATNLFTNNHAYTSKIRELHKSFEQDIKPHFDSTFYVFQQLVKKYIEDSVPGVVQTRFNPSKHITYVKFREKWLKKFNHTPTAYGQYGPAISWHVIRTYIKGWNSESYLSPELYSGIGGANKSVSDEVFKTVYEEVWEKWYSKLQEQEGSWDDQDLVRYCLAPDDDSCETCVSDRFSAVFCDESQDFTRTEIDFILRISTFSKRKIYGVNTLYQLPFVFAGDEFQTLNPTGFSWSSLRSHLTEELMLKEHKLKDLKEVGAPEPMILTQNYRSPAPVTKLANRLQLLTQTRCRKEEKYTPQIPYQLQDRKEPVLCLSPDNPLVWKKLNSVGAVLIIPCSEGQSPKEFIEKSGIKDHFEFYDDGSAKNITILNPSQAKGLEYPNVAVYGFDTYKDLSFQNLLNWYTSDFQAVDNDSKEIEIKYFLSNAYVSATRATNRLFIISDFSESSFWAFAFSTEDQELNRKIERITDKMIQKAKWSDDNPAKDRELLGYIIKGDIDAITHDNFLNIEALAVSTKQRAMELSDAGLMRQAAARFREQNLEEEVTTCLAYACRFDCDYRNAAKNFEQIGDCENALEDYWTLATVESGSIREVLGYINNLREKVREFRVTLSVHALKNKITYNEFKIDLSDLWEYLENGSEKMQESFDPKPWNEILDIILRNIPKDILINRNDVNPIIELASKLEGKYGIELNREILAVLAFKVDEFSKAVDLWEKTKSRPREYFRAKCKLLHYPENLQFREQSGEPNWLKKVVDDYRSSPSVKLDDYQHKIVSRSLISCGKKEEVIDNLTYLWTNSADLKECKSYAGLARDSHLKYAEDCVDALFAYRFGNLGSFPLNKVLYKSPELNLLRKTLQKIKEINSAEFHKKISEVLETKSINKFFTFLDEEFASFSKSKWNWIIYYELGALMENRERFFDAQLFYEWAQKHSPDAKLKIELTIRWIVCRFRQADRSKAEEYDRILEKALQTAEEIGVPMDPKGEYPIEQVFGNWAYLYKEVLKAPPEKDKSPSQISEARKPAIFNKKNKDSQTGKEKADQKPSPLDGSVSAGGDNQTGTVNGSGNSNPVADLFPRSAKDGILDAGIAKDIGKFDIDKNQPIITNKISDVNQNFKTKVKDHNQKLSLKKEVKAMYHNYEIKNYKFRYNPQKNELSISLENDNEDLSVKIKNGVFPESSDFSINEKGRLVKAESKLETPFKYAFDKKFLRITDVESGMQMSFPVSTGDKPDK